MDTILMPAFIHEAGRQFLCEKGYDIVLAEEDRDSLLQHVPDVSAMLTGYGEINREIIAAAPKLRVIAKYGVGVDNIDCAFAAEQNVWVVNSPGANANAVAEYTISVMLALARHLVRLD